jgi:hypothetical protein
MSNEFWKRMNEAADRAEELARSERGKPSSDYVPTMSKPYLWPDDDRAEMQREYGR